jgi:hypothetical protein
MQSTPPPSPWKCALELRPDRSVASGSHALLAEAIGRGADLRVYTEFLHEEHIAPFSCTPNIGDPRNNGVYREVIDFRETILVDGQIPGVPGVAGITTLRQPLEPLTGFNGTQPKMSFFLYNDDGQQACAQVLLDDSPTTGQIGTRVIEPRPANAPKMSETEAFDVGTSGPSRNFIYDMEVYRYFVRDEWTEVLSHDEHGRVKSGSFDALERAQTEAREIKVGLRDLCADLGVPGGPSHEVFSLAGSGFTHTKRKTHEVLTHPLIRVAPGNPAIPLKYASNNWDVSWISIRTTGEAVRRTLHPYTRTWSDHPMRLGCRWFVR